MGPNTHEPMNENDEGDHVHEGYCQLFISRDPHRQMEQNVPLAEERDEES